ncbi:hypothetical protein T01_12675 [Trichinella spiralis]|uniref:PiggyBac transposable element-derived protein domain-containing protein n=1 Tax=Trichinella spiralis TaxID=6334 RepID=A0A0V1BW33_TRISP|nr:hypothetical protein T01_12675 [Trichinella spiralis]
MNMGGIDLNNMLAALYRIEHKSRKWTRRIFFWIISTAMTNAWQLEVAKDQTSHWPEITQTRRRCRLCSKLATCLCKKCSIYLCLSSNRNCFTEFHK